MAGTETRTAIADALALLRLAQSDPEMMPRALALAERAIRRAGREARRGRVPQSKRGR